MESKCNVSFSAVKVLLTGAPHCTLTNFRLTSCNNPSIVLDTTAAFMQLSQKENGTVQSVENFRSSSERGRVE